MKHAQPLPALVRALTNKYSGIGISAGIDNDAQGKAYRTIRFIGPRSLLVEMGLVPSDGGYEDALDEFGTRIIRGRDYAIHVHDLVDGECRGRLPSQHPENEKTKTIVAKILKRVAANVRASI